LPAPYLGEINDSQRESWCRTIEAFDPQRDRTLPLSLFPADRPVPEQAAGMVRLDEMAVPAGWRVSFTDAKSYRFDH